MITEEEKNKEQNQIEEPTYNREQQINQGLQQYNQQIDSAPLWDHNAFTNSYQTGERPLMDALMSNYTKPEQRITPEQEKKARRAAALTDGLTSLAEIFAHASGTNVRDRSGQKTSGQQTRDRLDELTDKYKEDMLRYNNARDNAMRQDFAYQMRAEMERMNNERQSGILKANNEATVRAAEQKRKDKIEDEERKTTQDREQKEWTRDNIDIPKMERQQRYDREKQYIKDGAASSRAKENDKNAFEVSVPKGTAGAEYNEHTGAWYVRESLDPARQQSIISSLPGGKTEYIDNNELYREQYSLDNQGKERITKVPFTDQQIIQHYLENGYRNIAKAWKKPHPATYAVPALNEANTQITTQSQPRRKGNVR